MLKKMAIDNQMIYLKMHNTNDGMKVFKKGTRFDYYLLQKTNRTHNTKVLDEDVEYDDKDKTYTLIQNVHNHDKLQIPINTKSNKVLAYKKYISQ